MNISEQVGALLDGLRQRTPHDVQIKESPNPNYDNRPEWAADCATCEKALGGYDPDRQWAEEAARIHRETTS